MHQERLIFKNKVLQQGPLNGCSFHYEQICVSKKTRVFSFNSQLQHKNKFAVNVQCEMDSGNIAKLKKFFLGIHINVHTFICKWIVKKKMYAKDSNMSSDIDTGLKDERVVHRPLACSHLYPLMGILLSTRPKVSTDHPGPARHFGWSADKSGHCLYYLYFMSHKPKKFLYFLLSEKKKMKILF